MKLMKMKQKLKHKKNNLTYKIKKIKKKKKN